MNIGILGYGFVGQAVAHAHKEVNDHLIIRDPLKGHPTPLSDFTQCEAIYVCLPTPSRDDGTCNTDILEQGLKDLLFVFINNPVPVICKSTAPPSFYKKIQVEYPNVIHCPEFLTATNHLYDYLNCNHFVLGGDYDWAVKAKKIISRGLPSLPDAFTIVSIETAALYKYMINGYLATKVTFMNDFKRLADAEGVDFKDLKYLAQFDKRIGQSHMSVPGPDGEYGWGGACFPKDVAAIIEEAISLDVDFELLDRVEAINKKHRKLK
jgi:UDPglucose 6-dehydrogenase